MILLGKSGLGWTPALALVLATSVYSVYGDPAIHNSLPGVSRYGAINNDSTAAFSSRQAKDYSVGTTGTGSVGGYGTGGYSSSGGYSSGQTYGVQAASSYGSYPPAHYAAVAPIVLVSIETDTAAHIPK